MRLFLLLIFSWTVLGLVQCYLERHRPNKNFLVEVPSDYERKFKPDWSDLDRRPLPRWYDQAKIGIFLHWGVYSVPSFYGEWFWLNWKGGNKEIKEFMSKNYPPNFTYQDFAPMFKAEFFNPKKLADLFSQSGARYVVLTSKHHEGYTLFPSKRSFSWNSVDVGPGRDLVKDMATAVRNAGLKFGVYHSLYEWFNPIYLSDKSANFTRQDYIESKLWPDIKQLIYDYQPSILWSDGDWEANDTYWKSPQLLSWLYNESPVKDEVVVNDRWGKGIACHHGDFYNCADRYNPGSLQNHKWENAFTMDKSSWGFRREMEISDVYTMKELLKNVISTVSCGGNALINVGPTKEGTIAPIFQDRLQALGEWLDVNGEGIYGSSPWTSQNDTFNSNVWYTCTRTTYNPHKPTAKPVDMESIMNVYAFLLEWPDTNILELGDVVDLLIVRKWKITMLGVSNATLKWVPMPEGKIGVNLPEFQRVKTKHAWTLVFSPPENY